MSDFELDDGCRLLQIENTQETLETAITSSMSGTLKLNDLQMMELEAVIKNIQKCQVLVEESYHKSRKAMIAGSVMNITGSTLAIVGFALGFVTFGVSLGLVIPGTILGTLGAIIQSVTAIAYNDKAGKQLEHAQEVQTEMLKKLGLVDVVEKQKTKGFIKKIKFSKLWKFFRRSPINIGKFLFNFIKGNYKIADTVDTILKIVKAGGALGRTAWIASAFVTKFLTIVGVAADVVNIPCNFAFMIKGAYEVDKYKRTGKSNSNVAKKISELVKMMETKIRECHGGTAGQLMITD